MLNRVLVGLDYFDFEISLDFRSLLVILNRILNYPAQKYISFISTRIGLNF